MIEQSIYVLQDEIRELRSQRDMCSHSLDSIISKIRKANKILDSDLSEKEKVELVKEIIK